jgi:signal transduction histidine kinase
MSSTVGRDLLRHRPRPRYDHRLTPARRPDDAIAGVIAYVPRVDPAQRLALVPRRPPRVDLVIAAALACWALLEALLADGPGPMAVRIGFALAVTLPLAVRRQAPLLVISTIVALTAIRMLTADAPEPGAMPLPCIIVATFSVALYAKSTPAAIVGGLLAVGVVVVALTSDYYEGEPTAVDFAIIDFFVAGSWTAGWLVRRRAKQVERAVAESDELARSAVAEERARIARELHDVVAHSVSIVAVQAGAAEELLDSSPERAREHLAAVRRTAREAMTEMRRLLDVLRETDAAYAPQPGLARLSDLLDEVRASGVPVELIETGRRPELPAGVDLVAYRMIQESLTNVRKHAPGAPTRVVVTHGPGELELEVINEAGHRSGANGGGGHGLIGMRERARLYGGSFEAGEDGDGGFRVHARLPLGETG